jgi:hypothetical protein
MQIVWKSQREPSTTTYPNEKVEGNVKFNLMQRAQRKYGRYKLFLFVTHALHRALHACYEANIPSFMKIKCVNAVVACWAMRGPKDWLRKLCAVCEHGVDTCACACAGAGAVKADRI